jgi:hypothetical protein
MPQLNSLLHSVQPDQHNHEIPVHVLHPGRGSRSGCEGRSLDAPVITTASAAGWGSLCVGDWRISRRSINHWRFRHACRLGMQDASARKEAS